MPYSTPSETVIYAIGDIHGRQDLLEELLARIETDARRRGDKRRVAVYLGDYTSRGRDSRSVVATAMTWRPPGFEIVALRGNHEDIMFDFLAGDLARGAYWFDYDGMDALAGYGVAIPDRTARAPEQLEPLRQAFIARLPADHLAFFQSLKIHHDEGGYRFVHAGVRPGVPLAEQTAKDQMWIREPFLSSDADHGAVIVHGHSISPEPELRHNRIGIDTGAYHSGILTAVILEDASITMLRTHGPARS